MVNFINLNSSIIEQANINQEKLEDIYVTRSEHKLDLSLLGVPLALMGLGTGLMAVVEAGKAQISKSNLAISQYATNTVATLGIGTVITIIGVSIIACSSFTAQNFEQQTENELINEKEELADLKKLLSDYKFRQYLEEYILDNQILVNDQNLIPISTLLQIKKAYQEYRMSHVKSARVPNSFF